MRQQVMAGAKVGKMCVIIMHPVTNTLTPKVVHHVKPGLNKKAHRSAQAKFVLLVSQFTIIVKQNVLAATIAMNTSANGRNTLRRAAWRRQRRAINIVTANRVT